jgi:hypothetical protein
MGMQVSKTVMMAVNKKSHIDDRIRTAKGLVDLEPSEKLTAMFILSHEKDERLKDTAREGLRSFPEAELFDALKKKLDDQILKKIAELNPINEKLLLEIASNHGAGPEVIRHLAAKGPRAVAALIAENINRLQEDASIFSALKKNPNFPAEEMEKVSWLFDSPKDGDTEDEDEAEDADSETPVVEIAPNETHDSKVAPAKTAPAEVAPAVVTPPTEPAPTEPTPTESADAAAEPEPTEEEIAAATIPDELTKEDSNDDTEVNGEIEEEGPQNLTMTVKNMNVSEKIKLGLMGNKEVREMLIKSTNKLISSAVLNNPRITDDEIIKLCNTKGTSEDLLRNIARNREWMAVYVIKHGLILNPKTPIAITIRLLPQLTERDLDKIARSKGISSAVTSNARKILTIKRKK